MKKIWFLKVVGIYVCICAGIFLFTGQSSGQFSYNSYGAGYQQPYNPYSYQQSYNPYGAGYQQSYNPYNYQQSYNPYSYQQAYNPYGPGYQQPYNPNPYSYQQPYNPYSYQQPYNPYSYQQPYNPYSYQQPYNPYGPGYQQLYNPYSYHQSSDPYGPGYQEPVLYTPPTFSEGTEFCWDPYRNRWMFYADNYGLWAPIPRPANPPSSYSASLPTPEGFYPNF